MTSALLLALSLFLPFAAPQDRAQRIDQAEALVSEGSYELARRRFEELLPGAVDEAQRRWLRFRVADCRWRQAAASENPDATVFDQGVTELQALLPLWERPEERDATWAAVEESLGSAFWARQNARDWGQAWQHASQALAFWAASADLDAARPAYLRIVRGLLQPPRPRSWEAESYIGYLQPDVLENAARIALEPRDLGWTHYFLARRFTQSGGDPRVHARTREAYEAVLELGRAEPYYDDALYNLGVWNEERGTLNHDAERGTWTEPDFPRALELFRRLVRELPEGESRYRKQAEERIKRIVGPEVSLTVGNVFLPDSIRKYGLRWRNVERIELALYALDLSRDARLKDQNDNSGSWLDTLVPTALERVARWEYETGDDGSHKWGTAELELDAELGPGAYLIEANAGRARSRELVLVSDAGLVIKAYDDRVAAWFADVFDGTPIPGATVGLWERDGRRNTWRRHELKTGTDGLAIFELEATSDWRELFCGARGGSRQAFATLSGRPGLREGERWMLYAFTDRPAYRPGQTVSWKLSARLREEQRLSTPAGRALRYVLHNPRGETASEGPITLNDFGSAWGELTPDASWPLGEYQLHIQSVDAAGKVRQHLAQSTLFRLEEYKLPEFMVSVEPARDDDGAPRLFALGDEVEAEVVAQYYFGGAVAEATVEVLVYQKPFSPTWRRPREFPWYFESESPQWSYWYGPGQLVQQQTLSTDAEGRVTVSFETPFDANQDFEYTIEARVTDSSRREVSGTGDVRVTRRLHFVHAWAEHELHRPGTEATLRFDAQDANGNALAISGEVALLRRQWVEVWRDPQGRELRGAELDALRRRAGVFPPPSGGLPWRRIRAEYEDVPISSTRLATDAEGAATWVVRAPRDGYYLARWSSADPRGTPVTAETGFVVADERTRELGLRGSELRIIADRDTFAAGEPGHVMLLAPASGSHVLFSVEAEGLIDLRVVELSGTVKLLRLDVNERWVPNVELVARGFSAGRALGDQRSIVVPPVEEFLDVALELAPEELLPGEEGEVRVTVRDHDGEPVRAEVALSLVDESVTAIQSEYAGDPRSFFYGTRRPHRVIGATSHDQRQYVQLFEDERDQGEWGANASEGYRGPGDSLRQSYTADFDTGVDSFALGGSRAKREGGPSGPGGPVSDSFQPAGGVDTLSANEARLGIPGGGGGGPAHELVVRSDFRETALWQPALVTDAAGRASAPVRYPDSLTRWKASARVATSGASVGWARGEARTRKPLVARLQGPRFLVVGDEATLSLVLTNRTDAALRVAPSFEVAGLRVLGFVAEDGLAPDAPKHVELDAQGSRRLDWRVRAEAPGEARLVGQGFSDELGDAVELRFPVEPHGIEALVAKSGRFDGDEVEVAVDIPAAREAGTTRFEVQVTPSLAVTMLDALPYLVQYPYGCTEQTLSRFMPAVVAKHTLEELGLDPAVAMERVYGGIEREHVDKTQRTPRAGLDDLDRAVQAGLERLYDFQHGDGGWSWWKEGESDPFMTAYVVWGLSLARDAGVEVDWGKLAAGGLRLSLLLVEAETNPDLVAWMLHAVSVWLPEGEQSGPRSQADKSFDAVYAKRDKLSAYGRALLALAAHELGRASEAQVLARNLANGVILDRPDASVVQRGGVDAGVAGERAHWGEDGIYRRWSEGGVEATAFALRALVAIDPSNALVQQSCDWLVANRRGAQWRNTRDTAICVLALADFLRASGELDRGVEYELEVNGSVLARRALSGDEILAAPAVFAVPDELVRDGANAVRIRRVDGEGPLYFATYARFTSLEEPIPPRGNELFLRRQYFKLVGRPTLLAGYTYERVPLGDGDEVKSGERVEVVLTIEAKNHLEYLVFEDLKPAGLEATSVRSGEALSIRELTRAEVEHRFDDGTRERAGVGQRVVGRAASEGYTGRSRSLHQELRDRLVAAFCEKLPQGVWEIRYDLRAEVPGRFHALPVTGHAMYVPEIRANGAEQHVVVEDREDVGR